MLLCWITGLAADGMINSERGCFRWWFVEWWNFLGWHQHKLWNIYALGQERVCENCLVRLACSCPVSCLFRWDSPTMSHWVSCSWLWQLVSETFVLNLFFSRLFCIKFHLCIRAFALGFNGFTAAGYNANALDLLPGYSGIIFSVSNTIATIPGIVSPILTGMSASSFASWSLSHTWSIYLFFLMFLSYDSKYCIGALIKHPDHPTAWEWREVFFIAAGINVIAIALWCLFASGKPIYDFNTRQQLKYDCRA